MTAGGKRNDPAQGFPSDTASAPSALGRIGCRPVALKVPLGAFVGRSSGCWSVGMSVEVSVVIASISSGSVDTADLEG